MKYILHDLKILDKKIFSRPALWFELVTYSQVDSPVHQVKCAKHYWEDHPEKTFACMNICFQGYSFDYLFYLEYLSISLARMPRILLGGAGGRTWGVGGSRGAPDPAPRKSSLDVLIIEGE